ncbi:MAG: hypothetical protein GF372_02975 [Candidatus Marinimicrobia bacterium]|nr:hypothetical protein [Candidatus Neomarinimicrobiota bacterium]
MIKNIQGRIVIILPLFLFINAVILLCSDIELLYSQEVESLTVQFRRTVATEFDSEVAEGQFYYKSSGYLFVEITNPVSQYLVFDNKKVLIYFPETQEGVEYPLSSNTIPFVDSFLGHMKNDFGLSDLGFEIVSHNKKQDTLFTTWSPATTNKKNLGRLVLGTLGEKIVYAESQDKKERPIKIVYFSSHKLVTGYYFPMEAKILMRNGNQTKTETISYLEISHNLDFPDHVNSFVVPPDANIKVIE